MWRSVFGTITIICFNLSCAALQDGDSPLDTSGTTDVDNDIDSDSDSDNDIDLDGDADTESESEPTKDTDTEPCVEDENEIEVQPINILILLDRSRSMISGGVGDETFSDITKEAIQSIVKGIAEKETDAQTNFINFGLATFPSLRCQCDDENPDSECFDELFQCTPAETIGDKETDNPIVPIADDNDSDIIQKLENIGTCGGTPICESLKWTQEYISELPTKVKLNPTYILLATDGAPNCGSYGPDPKEYPSTCECTLDDGKPCNLRTQCLDDKCTFNAAAQLKKEGIKTFVIGVGEDVTKWKNVLTDIAIYGGTEEYYPAKDPASLQKVFEEIIYSMLSCTFEVPWEDIPEYKDKKAVEKACNRVKVIGKKNNSDSDDIPYSWDCSDPNGWRWQEIDFPLPENHIDTPTIDECRTIELCPKACESFRTNEFKKVSATFGCPIILV